MRTKRTKRTFWLTINKTTVPETVPLGTLVIVLASICQNKRTFLTEPTFGVLLRLFHRATRRRPARLRARTAAVLPCAPMAADAFSATEIPPQLMDQRWRLSNLYYIKTKMDGHIAEEVHFEPNIVQQTIYQRLADGYRKVIILKPRKLGVTTGITTWMLDKTLYQPNNVCRTIAHRRETAGEIFNDGPLFSFERIDPILVPERKAGSTRELSFKNGSKYTIEVEARGVTPTVLHFTEAAYNEDQKKMEDSMESLPKEAMCIVESTANGRGNWFERTYTQAMEALERGEVPEWYPMFFAWFQDPNNRLPYDPATTVFYNPIDVNEMKARFPFLDNEQLLFWDRKKYALGHRLPELYPSTWREAFIFSTGKVYGDEFREELNMAPMMRFEDYRLCMDYGQTNPLAITLIHRDADDNFILFDEFYRTNAPLAEVRRWLEIHAKEKVDKQGYIHFDYCDPSIFIENQVDDIQVRAGDSPRKHRYSIADELRKKHKIILRRGTQNDIPAGLQRVKDYLKFDHERTHPFRRDSAGNRMRGAPRFFITQNCVNTKTEFETYCWPKDPAGALNQHSYEVPVKKNDHLMDCIRYTLLSWTEHEKAPPQPRPPVNTIAFIEQENRFMSQVRGAGAGAY